MDICSRDSCVHGAITDDEECGVPIRKGAPLLLHRRRRDRPPRHLQLLRHLQQVLGQAGDPLEVNLRDLTLPAWQGHLVDHLSEQLPRR